MNCAGIWAREVGKMGWEHYLPTEFTGPVFDLLVDKGKDFGIRLAGYHTFDSLRSEKSYRHWGHDISPADTPLEAGIGRQLGAEGLDTFRHTKMVMVDPGCKPQDFWWFPYQDNESFPGK